MSFALTFTAAALLAAPGGSALVFIQVNSPVEPAAKPLLEESLRQAFSSRMPVITCKETTEEETELKKILESRGIKSAADAPKKVALLAYFSKYGCEIPDDATLWAAWLTAYVDSRSGRREVSLRMRNLGDEKSKPSFASLAEPQDSRLSWSELVERCVRRYFEENESTQVQVAPAVRVRVLNPFNLQARLSFASAAEAESNPKLNIHWELYVCSESKGCDRFRDAVDEYVSCRRSNRARSVSDPSLTPVCLPPLESYDRVAVSALPDQKQPWLHWEDAPSPNLTVDIPGEYVLVASVPNDLVEAKRVPVETRSVPVETRSILVGAQRVSVEPPLNTVILFGGFAYKGGPNYDKVDAFAMATYDFAISPAPTPIGYLSVGVQWGARLGAARSPPPPFGIRGLVAPILRGRHHFTSNWIAEVWVAPAGVLYEFKPEGDPTKPEGGYALHLGSMVGLAIVLHPGRLPFTFRAGVMGVTETFNLGHSEVYGPLLGIGFEW